MMFAFCLLVSGIVIPRNVTAQILPPDALKSIHIRSIGPAAMSGRITAITCDPKHPEVIYAGAASGGVWRSKSGGTQWEPIFDRAPTQSIGSIAVNPRNPDEIWVGTGEGNPRNSQNFGVGIFKSIDGGEHWTCMGLQNTHTIHRVILHRDRPDVIWAASLGSAYGPNEDRGVFKSTDGGKTWRKVLYVNDLTGCAELVVDPRNPDKLFAAMWEYQRWPWFFNSGGKGSGIYVSYDGGEHWERLSEKEGLPEGELGRCGLAIARSNPGVVYALVEAKDNAIYKSTDGGRKWRKMADKDFGGRPFYYAELYVDPKNEDRVYSIHSIISRSEDGGKSFETWAGWRIHPDHHAFWIHPENPDYIINGNDGGLNITLDGGRTWRYAENIPVGQFYHVETDDERPYNVYGGLQDNGSWVGPSAVWKAGGMRNSEWQEVLFGDGFETLPRGDDSRYLFAMWQGGELHMIDRQTGDSRFVKPLHPDGKTELRCNWNAALARDPWQPQGIFFGSQFLHHSYDAGQNWQLLSPDLTTNDTSKLHQDISGGLTVDATNAENYCSIVAIAPSPVTRGLAWVGTDDGNVQLTNDHGKTWTNFADKLPGAPKNGWIPAIEASRYNDGEAFVVLNNYRQNDWQPYLYHTTDYGKTWSRLVSPGTLKREDGKVADNNFCLSLVQDPIVADLLFLGTDQGLYVSIDHGSNWNKWPVEALPSVPVNDMKIQVRDGDLVIGTFGRGIWILDNLAPLRDLARTHAAILDKPFKMFPAQPGVLAEYSSYEGPRFAADANYQGENKSFAVVIPVWVKPGMDKASGQETKTGKEDNAEGKSKGKPAKKKEKALVTILSLEGDTLRQFKTELDTAFSTIRWGMDTRGVRFPSKNEPNRDQPEPGGGPRVLPGEYQVKVKYMEYADSLTVSVIQDPRVPVPPADRQANAAAIRDLYQDIERSAKAYDRLKEAEKTIRLVEEQWVNVPDSVKKEVLKIGKTLKDSIGVLKELFFKHEEGKGIEGNPNRLNNRFSNAIRYINGGQGAPNASARLAIGDAKKHWAELLEKVNALFDGPWKEFRSRVEAVQYSLFKDFDKL
ncbi:MAG: hypothetical protein H6565_06535 [Lewinellaceae bacterium]|nr:hypothetical protein [Lewinellaceae bacterium]